MESTIQLLSVGRDTHRSAHSKNNTTVAQNAIVVLFLAAVSISVVLDVVVVVVVRWALLKAIVLPGMGSTAEASTPPQHHTFIKENEFQ